MDKCSKCGNIISDIDIMAWKCMECGKAFKVNLSKLKKIQMLKNKSENIGKMLLKCPNCGKGIDNGNEKIACKCSACGNVMIGTLMDFTLIEKHEVEHKDVNTKVYENNVISKQNIHKQNRKNKDSRKIMVIFLILLICASEDAMDRFMTAANNQNEGSLYELLLNGEIAYTEQGTKCNIVDRKFTRCQVKLLDGSYAGSTVWVIIEALQEK